MAFISEVQTPHGFDFAIFEISQCFHSPPLHASCFMISQVSHSTVLITIFRRLPLALTISSNESYSAESYSALHYSSQIWKFAACRCQKTNFSNMVMAFLFKSWLSKN